MVPDPLFGTKFAEKGIVAILRGSIFRYFRKNLFHFFRQTSTYGHFRVLSYKTADNFLSNDMFIVTITSTVQSTKVSMVAFASTISDPIS